jgi:DNA primase
MIKANTVRTVMDTAQIEDVVKDYVNLKRSGSNMIGLCPFHNEKTPSFVVSPGKNIFKCFGCSRGGDPVRFIMEHEGFSFPEAIKHLARKYNIEIELQENPEQYREEEMLRESLFIINEYAGKYFEDQLWNSDHGRNIALSYFKERGFLDGTIKKFQLGFAPESERGFTLRAVNEGYKEELLKQAGVTSQYGKDFFRNRVMFPIRNLSGKIIGFGGRILSSSAKGPKYINTSETTLYNKRKVLFGLYEARDSVRKEKKCLLVEGYTDVLSLHQSGIENVVSTSGTALTLDQVRLLKRYTDQVIFVFDGDPAGLKAALRGMDVVFESDMNVRAVTLPKGHDPDSYIKEVGSSSFSEYIAKEAKDALIFMVSILLSKEDNFNPHERATAYKEILEKISKIPSPLKRALYIQECSRISNISESVLIKEVNKLISRRIRKRQEEKSGIKSTDNTQKEDAFDRQLKEEGNDQLLPQWTTDYQERDIIRILITAGDKEIKEENKETKINIAKTLIANLKDVTDYFNNDLYKKILTIYIEASETEGRIGAEYFLHHPEDEIKKIALDILTEEYSYSPNWENKLQSPLQSQKMPEENYTRDIESSLLRYKLNIIKIQCKELEEKLANASNQEEQTKLLDMLQRVYQLRNLLTEKTQTVILG